MGYTKTTFDKEANIMYHDVHIDDYNYFSMIDNQIRSEYTLCEEFTLLPKILKLYKDNEISPEEKDLIHYPTEGYYYKTPGLTRFFQLVRNLQENPTVYKKVKPSIEVDELIWLFGSSIWGTVPSLRSETIFPRMKDILIQYDCPIIWIAMPISQSGYRTFPGVDLPSRTEKYVWH